MVLTLETRESLPLGPNQTGAEKGARAVELFQGPSSNPTGARLHASQGRLQTPQRPTVKVEWAASLLSLQKQPHSTTSEAVTRQ